MCSEQKEKQEAKERYMKLHLAGKTDQAKADLARLAAIRKEREEANAKRKAEAEGERSEAAASGENDRFCSEGSRARGQEGRQQAEAVIKAALLALAVSRKVVRGPISALSCTTTSNTIDVYPSVLERDARCACDIVRPQV